VGWALPFGRIVLLLKRKADIEVPNHWFNVSFHEWLACYPLSSFDSIYFGWRSLIQVLLSGMRNTAIKRVTFIVYENMFLLCSPMLWWRRSSPQWNRRDTIVMLRVEWMVNEVDVWIVILVWSFMGLFVL